MVRTILVAGTESHSGKSTVAAGLCRLLYRRGNSVAPFKGQNMSNNARAVLSPVGGCGEIGISQYTQAKAAEVRPTTDMNPVLLKPQGEGESQLVVQGEVVGHLEAESYYETHWEEARRGLVESFNRLAEKYDVIIAEGAGSIAEINLQNRDLANIETAKVANAEILLVVNIERGGAFASLYGTVELLPGDIRDRVIGAVINKFRGNRRLLKGGIEQIEARLGIPILGVLPYTEISLPEEDSLSIGHGKSKEVWGKEDGYPDGEAVQIAVPKFRRISNFTDLEPLARTGGVRVVFVSPDSDLSFADAVVLPGTNNTLKDLLRLHERGFVEKLRDFEGYVVGLCEGYQMLGQRILNSDEESTDQRLEEVEGIGLLPVVTTLSKTKQVKQVSVWLEGTGPLKGARGMIAGYETHRGSTTGYDSLNCPVEDGSASTKQVLGTYLHGLFENEIAREAFVQNLFSARDINRPKKTEEDPSPYELVADLLDDNLRLDWLLK